MRKLIYTSVLSLVVVLALTVPIVWASVESDLGAARRASAKYQEFDRALEDGFQLLFECISNPTEGAMGFHYIRPDRFDGTLKLTEPEAVLYEQQPSGRMRLVAIEYVIPASAWTASEPPTFLGQTFKYKTTVGPHDVDPYYELHVWLWKNNPSGVFADWNPRVSCAD